MNRPIDPQSAVETMWKTAPRLAEAKAERIYMEEYRHSLKAILMKSSGQQTSAAQERDAYADQQYVDHLKALRIAVEKEEKLKWQMVTLDAAIQVWRSTEASNRRIDGAAA